MTHLSIGERFVEFAIQNGAMKFGKFKLKSGRESPYFFNSSGLNTGEACDSLSRAYVIKMHDEIGVPDFVYGPAYKGIPLCAIVSMQMYHYAGKNVKYVFNRKEEKTYGDGGLLVGLPDGQVDFAGAQIVIVDDVITSGKSSKEALDTIKAFKGHPKGIVIGFDRREKYKNLDESAVEIFQNKHDVPVYSAASLQDLVNLLRKKPNIIPNAVEILGEILVYNEQYGFELKDLDE
jgi:orotate phosphoribosyltransferase